MSTKTTLKRVALVAVATLAFGTLSVAPSNAIAGTATAIAIANTTTVAGTALAASKYTSAPVLDELAISAFSVTAGQAVILHLTAIGGTFDSTDTQTRVTLRGFGGVVATDVNAATLAGVEDPLPTFNAPTVVGTYTLDVETALDFTANGHSSQDLKYSVVMTVTAPTGVSPVLSTAFITSSPTAVATSATNLVTASGSATAATANSGSILMSMFNTSGSSMTSGNTVLAQITSGPGYLFIETPDTPTAGQCGATPTFSAIKGRAVTLAIDAVSNLIICADGTAGVATISLSVTNNSVTTAWTTKSYTFYGAVRTLAVEKSNFTIGAAGGDETGAASATRDLAGEVTNAGALTTGTTTPAFIISAKDSAGQLATAAAVPAVISSNPTVVASGTCILDAGSATYGSGSGFGLYNCSFTTAASAVSGNTATLTFRINDPLGTAGIDYLTTTVVVTVGGTRLTETLALNKATYTEGEAMVVTRTAKDSAGNPVADGSAAPAVVFNKAVGGTAPGAGFYVGGTLATSSTVPGVFAPTASGVFEARMSGRSGSTTTVPIITTATIAESAAETAAAAAGDAAAEATDAANAATDAANAAAEAADAATAAAQDAADAVAALATSVTEMVNALKKQITSLTNLVIKIQKKVKA